MDTDTPSYAKAVGQGNYSAQAQTTAAPKQSQSEQTLTRMAKIISVFNECRSMAGAAGERILGPQPQEAGSLEGVKSAPATGFMNNLEYDISQLERLGQSLRDELGRLVRAF